MSSNRQTTSSSSSGGLFPPVSASLAGRVSQLEAQVQRQDQIIKTQGSKIAQLEEDLRNLGREHAAFQDRVRAGETERWSVEVRPGVRPVAALSEQFSGQTRGHSAAASQITGRTPAPAFDANPAWSQAPRGSEADRLSAPETPRRWPQPEPERRSSGAPAGPLVLREPSPPERTIDPVAACERVFDQIKAFCNKHACRPPRTSLAGRKDLLGIPPHLKRVFPKFCHPDTWHAMLKDPAERPYLFARYFAECLNADGILSPAVARDFDPAPHLSATIRATPQAPSDETYAAQRSAFLTMRRHEGFEAWVAKKIATQCRRHFDDVSAVLDFNSPDTTYAGPGPSAVRAEWDAVARAAIIFAVDAHGLPGATRLTCVFERFGHTAHLRPQDMVCVDRRFQPFDQYAASRALDDLRVRLCVMPGVSLKVQADGHVDHIKLVRAEVLVFQADQAGGEVSRFGE